MRYRLIVAVLCLVGASLPARADLIVSALDPITLEGVTAQAGGTGSFDVSIINLGPDPVDLGSFQLELSVEPSSGVHFTGVSASTSAPYVFEAAGSAPSSSDTFPNVDFTARTSITMRLFNLPFKRSRQGRFSAWLTSPSRSIRELRPVRSTSRSFLSPTPEGQRSTT